MNIKKLFSVYLTLISINVFSQAKLDFEKLDDAVVVVKIFDFKGNYYGHGSGFIIDAKGTIVTNYHVVEDASSLKIMIDNKGIKEEYDVDYILKGDAEKDLAILSIKNNNKSLPFLKIAKQFPKKGDECWAIGTPQDLNYMNTLSNGLVSNIHDDGVNLDGIQMWKGDKIIQINAAITHGSSGGALFNEKGEVIGVTCGGDENGISNKGDIKRNLNKNRAQLNFAISINEINSLPVINKRSVVNPAAIPCQLGFYTNNPYTSYVSLYIDGLYVGNFNKYFLNNTTPSCGQEGTITRYLSAGVHSYQVYYAETGEWFYGTINLSPGQCQMFRIAGEEPYDYSFFNPFGFQRKKIENRGYKKWVIATGFSFVETGRGLPIPLFIEKQLTEKYSIRGNIQWRSRSSDPQAGIKFSNRYFGLGADFKRIFPRPYRWNWFLAGTINYRSLKLHYTEYENVYTNNGYTTVDKSYDEFKNHSFMGLRLGGDRYTTENFYITWDFGYGYHTFYKDLLPDMNLLLGYRF